MAAHLHDSVLQTLALIQRTEDPNEMVALARGQERELRTWLYGKTKPGGEARERSARRGRRRGRARAPDVDEIVMVGTAARRRRSSARARVPRGVRERGSALGARGVSAYVEVEETR